MQRALLTKRERDVLRDIEMDHVTDPRAYKKKLRYRIRQRINQLETDIQVLEETYPEMAAEARKNVLDDAPTIQDVLNELQEHRDQTE